MAQDNKYSGIMESLMKGMDSFLSSKTVVGDPIKLGDTTVIPLLDVSFGVGMGAGSGTKGDKGCGGIGGKMSPNAVLIIGNGSARLVSVKSQDSFTKILDMVPDLVNKFTVPAEKKEKLAPEVAISAAFPESNT
jgi:uncharacterized spore protein YtfJ